MADQQAAKPGGSNRTQIMFFVLCCYLLATFLYRVLAPAHEYPRQPMRILEMAIDAGIIAGLFATRKSGPQWLLIVALIAGIGLFGIRMHNNDSWYTGHWNYSLTPR